MKWENGFDQVSRSNILTFTSRSDRMACYKPVLLARITRTAELKKKKKKLFTEIRVFQATGTDSPKSCSKEKLTELGWHSLLSARGHLLILKKHTIRGEPGVGPIRWLRSKQSLK